MSTHLVSTQFSHGKTVAKFYKTDTEQHDSHVLRWNSFVREFYRREYLAGGERL